MPLPGRAVILALAAGCTPLTWQQQDESTDLPSYRQAFATEAGDTFTDTWSRQQLLAAIGGVRVLWLGDHHRSERLHALHAGLLADVQRSGRRVVFALEAIGEQDEAAVRDWLRSMIPIDSLRARVKKRWPDSWLEDGDVDGAHYRSLLSLAREQRAPVYALEPTPRPALPARDAAIVVNVQRAANAHPDRLVVAIVGQAHLAGEGDVVARAGLPSIAIGGEPTPALLAAVPAAANSGALHRSSGGLWWFDELLRN